jgi:hypothetical protein
MARWEYFSVDSLTERIWCTEREVAGAAEGDVGVEPLSKASKNSALAATEDPVTRLRFMDGSFESWRRRSEKGITSVRSGARHSL